MPAASVHQKMSAPGRCVACARAHHSERHGPTRAVDLLGQLDPGGRRADHEHAALSKPSGDRYFIAVCGRRSAARCDAAADGTRAELQAPLATTNARHRQRPRSVTTS